MGRLNITEHKHFIVKKYVDDWRIWRNLDSTFTFVNNDVLWFRLGLRKRPRKRLWKRLGRLRRKSGFN